MKPLLVVNPRSGGGKAERVFPEIRATIERALGQVEIAFTESEGHGVELARAGAEAGHPLVVSVGGDGTFNEVVNGVLASGRRDVEVGIIGQGTGGDFLRTLGIEHRLDRYLDALTSGETRRFDVGRARYTKSDGSEGERYFVSVLSAGMGGLVDRYVATASRALGGKAAYCGVGARARHEPRGAAPRDDHARRRDDRAPIATYMIAVCNGRWFGSGMNVAPMAGIDDGAFEIVSIGAPSKLAFALTGPTIPGAAPVAAGRPAPARADDRDGPGERGRAPGVPHRLRRRAIGGLPRRSSSAPAPSPCARPWRPLEHRTDR